MIKPDPRLFGHILGEVGVAPDRVLFLDDCEDHVVAATEHGIRGEHVCGVDEVRASIRRNLPQVQVAPGVTTSNAKPCS